MLPRLTSDAGQAKRLTRCELEMRLHPFQPVWSRPAKPYLILIFFEAVRHMSACMIGYQRIGQQNGSNMFSLPRSGRTEHDLAKVGVEGSNPFARSKKPPNRAFLSVFAFRGNKTSHLRVSKSALRGIPRAGVSRVTAPNGSKRYRTPTVLTFVRPGV